MMARMMWMARVVGVAMARSMKMRRGGERGVGAGGGGQVELPQGAQHDGVVLLIHGWGCCGCVLRRAVRGAGVGVHGGSAYRTCCVWRRL